MQHASCYSPCQRFLATLLLCSLLLQSCGYLNFELYNKSPASTNQEEQVTDQAPKAHSSKGVAPAVQKEEQNRASQLLSQVFTASGGQSVEFRLEGGQWQARLTECPKGPIKKLPVACERHGDIESALLALQAKSSRHARSRIHVLPGQGHYSPMVYIGQQGLLGGGRGEPSTSEQGPIPTEVPEETSGDITSTAALVKALNAAQTPAEQQALQQWIRRYIDWFNGQPVGNLTLAPGNIQEYTCLAHIQATPANRELLASYFDSLYNKIDQKYQYNEGPLLKALEYTLQNIDSKVFAGNCTLLIHLGDKLLARLGPNRTNKNTYPTHRSRLSVLHQALVLIQQIDPTQLNPTGWKAQFDQLKKSTKYYPIKYHALLLEQSLKCSAKHQACLQETLSECNAFNVKDFQKGWQHLKEAFTRQGISAAAWYDWHQTMHYASLLSLDDASKYEEFKQGLAVLLLALKAQKISPKEGRQALRFGIVQQLRLLALQGPTAEVRKQSIEQLKALTDSWAEDAEVMAGLLDGLAALTRQGQEAEKKAARAALVSLTDSPLRPARRRFSLLSSDCRKAAALASITEQWLEGQTLADKLSALPAPAAPAPGGLFRRFNDGTFNASRKARQAPRAYYQHPDFAQVLSSFEGAPPKHVDTLECTLLLEEQGQGQEPQATHEQRARGKTPIALEDLFKPRSTQPGGPAQAIHKVLLVGEAGTGKTTLSKKIAYRWAQGKWGQEFNAVYVLPVRKLQQSKYDNVSMRRQETLATAIANNCFHPMEGEEYVRLHAQISEELEKPTTLVVLDGLDERAGASEALLSQANAGSHKLLMLSRPYNIEQERTMADLAIVHAGFSEGQMEAYVRGDLSANRAEELLSFIKEHPAIASIAHMPVSLQLLCYLWKDDGTGVRAETSNGSLHGLYRMLTEYTWERYVKKWRLEDAACEEVFDALGKLALEPLEQGEELIGIVAVDDVLGINTRRNLIAMLQDSGFLSLQSVGSQYQLPHLTFQEYFAGRLLAKQLFSSEAKVQKKAQNFFSKHQYAPQYGQMLSFLAGEVSKEQGVEGLRKLLSLLQEAPQEVVGVQHMLLQLRLLNEWLCVAGEDDLAALEEELHVLRSLEAWFVKGLECVRSGNDRKLLELLTTALQRLRAVAGHASAQVLPRLLAAAKDADDNVHSAASSALAAVAQAAPEPVLAPLLAAAKDEDALVRSAASSALGQLVQAAPEQAAQVLPRLIEALQHSNWQVRSAASDALVEVVQATPEQAAQVCELLIAACEASSAVVQSAARFALVLVVQAAPEQAAQVHEHLIKALRDADAAVRSTACSALAAVAQAAPEQAAQVRELLIAAEEDNNKYVRIAACSALGQLVQAAPAQATQVHELLIKALRDADADVRSTACSALAAVAQAAPAKAAQVREHLIKALRDADADVRSTACSALAAVAQAAPAQAGPVCELLKAACENSSAAAQSAARFALVLVVQTAPEQAAQVRELLIAAEEDNNKYVRIAACSALGQLVQAAPAQAAQVREHLIKALRDADAAVRSTACSALGQFSLQQLMDAYWATQDQVLIPFIAPQLYHTPLSVQPIPHSQDQRLVLYPTAGQAVKWRKSQQAVQDFVQQIQSAVI